jgi:RNA polymerase sigma-70 factor (ECF subfamily)
VPTLTRACSLAVSDEQLLGRYAVGRREALDELFRRHRGPAYRVAYRLLGQEADALDAVQNGFVKALRHLGGFRGRSSFKTWLLRIVTNAALDLRRQRERRRALAADAARPRGAGMPAPAADPGRGAEEAELRERLAGALQVLPAPHRKTFVLHADGGLSYREVADALGIPVGTVMSRLFYARRRLRAALFAPGASGRP